MNKAHLLVLAATVISSTAAVADEQRRPPALNPQHQWQQPQQAAPAPAPAPLVAPQLTAPAPAPQAVPAPAPTVDGRTPLVVIRFNKETVNYNDQLYSAVSEAVKVSPNVMFDVVGGARAGEVVSALNKIGVPHSRISTQQRASNQPYEEVKVYVR